MNFYRCERCGNIMVLAEDKGVPVMCCGEKMQKVTESCGNGAAEKHIPVVSTEGNVVRVSVGEVTHPITEEHYIGWTALVTNKGVQIKKITGETPEAKFCLDNDEKVECAYAYCNLHGFFKSK